MRRKDRQMGKDFGLYVIDKAAYCTLSTLYQEDIYSLPLSFARVEDYIYIHGAQEGTKVLAFESNTTVNLVFVCDLKVPDELTNDQIRSFTQPGKVISQVFTTEYASTIARGKISPCTDDEDKIKGLRAICLKYTPDKMEFFDQAIALSLNRTNLWKISLDEISAKRKKLAPNLPETRNL